MSGVAAEIQLEGLPEVEARLRRMASWDRGEAMFAIGVLLENSAKERIDSEKTAPDGTAWAPWSARYDETRERRHSLLVGEGDLRDSIQAFASGAEVRVGSNLIYAATHQFGRDEVNIPARPFLGISEDDRDDIRDVILGGLEEAVS